MGDQLIRATAATGSLRILAIETTHLTETARQRHDLSPPAAILLGRTMAAGLLLAANFKQPHARINLRLRGTGPIGGLMVDAGRDGTVRGYVEHPRIELPTRPDGTRRIGDAIGAGYLYVLRDVGHGEPYSSTVELISGEVGDDIAYYLATSEQTPSAVVVGVATHPTGIRAAGGLLLQILPQASDNEDLKDLLEQRAPDLSRFSQLLSQGETLPDILEILLGDLGLDLIPDIAPVSFTCRCSRDRVLSALKLLGQAELRDMITQDNGAEANCDFCNELYKITDTELEDLITQLSHQDSLV